MYILIVGQMVAQVYKDDSMVYTEDDFSEQVFSNEISQLAPENLTKDVTQNKNLE